RVDVSSSIEVKITKQDHRRVMSWLQGSIGQVIVTKFHLQISRYDIRTLFGGNWVNDNVINFYMELLNERSKKNAGKLPSVYAMNTFFMPRLLKHGFCTVRRWTKKVNLFSKQIIPVPVHFSGQPNHWSMAIIDMRHKTIRFYDSMGKRNDSALEALKMYLQQESVDKRKENFDTSDFKLETAKDVPQQYNGNDCGVFCCMFAEYITRDAPLTFTQAHMVAMRKKMILEILERKLRT
ncbi:hypothetical protein KR059_001404, partial [Drosophila kikkawai]